MLTPKVAVRMIADDKFYDIFIEFWGKIRQMIHKKYLALLGYI